MQPPCQAHFTLTRFNFPDITIQRFIDADLLLRGLILESGEGSMGFDVEVNQSPGGRLSCLRQPHFRDHGLVIRPPDAVDEARLGVDRHVTIGCPRDQRDTLIDHVVEIALFIRDAQQTYAARMAIDN